MEDTRGFRPITEFIERDALILREYIEDGTVLDALLVADAWTEVLSETFTLGATFRFPKMDGLHLPGLEEFQLGFNQDAMAEGVLVCGPEPSLSLEKIELVLSIDPRLLRTPENTAAQIEIVCGLRLDRDGFHFTQVDEASLKKALVAGTEVSLSLEGIHLDVSKSDEFFRVRRGTLTVPSFTNALDKSQSLTLTASNLSLGRHGVSGRFERSGSAPLKFEIYGFACELERAAIHIEHGQIIAVDLTGRLDLSKFEAQGEGDGWLDVTFSIGPSGLVASLDADHALVELEIPKVCRLSVDTIRLETSRENESGILWLSGELTPTAAGVKGQWPKMSFHDLGFTSAGHFRLSEGASIATTQPFVVEWNFLKLTVTAFSFQRPKEAPNDLEFRISASVEVVQGIPAGASVDGLVVRRSSDGSVGVRFEGIGIKFGAPGAYAVAATVSWNSAKHALGGTGHLDIESLGIRLDVAFHSESENGTTTLLIAAEADVVPGGIAIGTTGLSLYAISGLLAHNLRLQLDSNSPRPYFDKFKSDPPGFAARSKWEVSAGSHALGLGVVIGTSDDGWVFSARGALMLLIPEMTLLLTANGDLLTERSSMDSTREALLTAVLAVYPAEHLARLDFAARWSEGDLFYVEGEGAGEFRFDRPFAWSLNLGKPPEVGQPITARALRLLSRWLIDGGYWLGIDAQRSARIGMRSQLELRTPGGGIYAEIIGWIRADLGLCWKPSQLEGDLKIGGRARLVGGGLSFTFTLDSSATVRLPEPTLLKIPLAACLHIKLWKKKISLCLRHTFQWSNDEEPKLEALLQSLSAVPRHWAPRLSNNLQSPINQGVAYSRSSGINQTLDLGKVQPHSEFVLEASKSLLVRLPVGAASLNDSAEPLPQLIGQHSKRFARWSLKKLELKDTSDSKLVDLFGTFTRSPRTPSGASARPVNTQLWLLSSKRFGVDGSLGSSGAEHSKIDCSTRGRTREQCVDLRNLSPGFGTLPMDWAYEWLTHGQSRDSTQGVWLKNEDEFYVFAPKGITTFRAVFVKVGKLPKILDPTYEDVSCIYPDKVRVGRRNQILIALCWRTLVAGRDADETQDWSGSVLEEWQIDTEKRLLRPGHTYELTVGTEGELLTEQGMTVNKIVMERIYRFEADRAPDWGDSLSHAVEAVYPDNGQRPVYRNYDLHIRFKDDFFEALYRLDNRPLGVRILDANGNLLKLPTGEWLLPTSWIEGSVSRSPAEQWWIAAHADNPQDPCESATPAPPPTAKTVMRAELADLHLAPYAQYFAEVVAVSAGKPSEPLYRWTFTTSKFATFAEIASPLNTSNDGGLLQLYDPTDSTFDALIRACGAPAVSVVDAMRMMPIRKGKVLSHLLIEAPEPLDDAAGRLRVTIDGVATVLTPNLDRTRIIATLTQPIALTNPDRSVTVTVAWTAVPQDKPTECYRTIRGDLTRQIETVQWMVSLAGLF